jgi:hypothetical protein
MTLEEWFTQHEGKPTTPAVQRVVDTISAKAKSPEGVDTPGSYRSVPPVEFMTELAKLAARGHGGVPEALAKGLREYTDTHMLGDSGGHAMKAYMGALEPILKQHGGLVDAAMEELLFVDTKTLTTNTEGRSPETGHRTDGAGLFYSHAVNMVYGLPETGKSLLMAGVASQVLEDGGSVLWIDVDHNSGADILSNLEGMGADRDTLDDTSRFRLAQPTTKEEFAGVVGYTSYMKPTLVVLDSLGEALSIYEVNPEAEAYAGWNAQTLAPMADTGATVVVIDHSTKSESNPNFALGSQRKKAALNGSMLRAKLAGTLIPGIGGSVVLTISKDRPGGLRKSSPVSSSAQTAAIFSIGATLGDWAISAPPTSAEELAATPGFTASGVSDLDVLKALSPAPSSVADVRARMAWGTVRASEAMKQYRASLTSQ